ncbi:hypothetical protein [Ruegeria conchae]|uniref:Glyoxalase/bleomycin resistance protein/dioxygenase superfamily protein n=1 Tax=Ruegeria conchae TaxID=981384 RepID=A0A497YRD2_9RHOB|nr:hypothetical protein [Ruegeria conchae]RLJ98469.1 hypothetical protein CLV75_4168 [Ruegeria conchae]
MEKVLGFGGFFFWADEPANLAAWYRDKLGINLVPNDYETPCWTQEAGETVFALFEKVTEYFGDQEKASMLNFRVCDIEKISHNSNLRVLTSAEIRYRHIRMANSRGSMILKVIQQSFGNRPSIRLASRCSNWLSWDRLSDLHVLARPCTM